MNDINDSVNKSAGRGYIIIDNVINELSGLTKVSSKRTVKTRSKTPLGSRVVQTKVVGVENDIQITVEHYETARFNQMIDEYIKTGKMPVFDLQIINEDESSTVGRRVVRYYECILKGDVSLNELEESEDGITSDIPATCREIKIIEDYNYSGGANE